ncbi:MAG: hypothetical protein R3Y28_08530 [Candidatus Gastranaerophilales bacterium]
MLANSKLKLECLAIGSLPHKNLDDAMQLVSQNFSNVPFWPQLVKIKKNEDMIFQFLENMPSFFLEDEKFYLETESEKFYEEIEQFFIDYENIIEDYTCDDIEKYAITSNNSSSFNKFIDIIKQSKPSYAKGQIVGPFTLSTTLVDKLGRCAIYDETLREIIVKTLIIKALWQIKQIKLANPNTTPIIFLDEPSISQLGTSAFITICQNDVIKMFSEIITALKNADALVAIHCCGKCDWHVPILAKIDIINLDAFAYAQNLSLFEDDIKKFLIGNGKIAWGVVPTLDKNILEKIELEELIQVFDKAVKYLTKKGIDEKIIIENSLITPSCGAGGLDEKLARKAMNLTKQLSDYLKERYAN